MVKSCKKLRNYRARTKKGKKYVRRGFYCKTCGRKIKKMTSLVFGGECWTCVIKGF